VVPRVARKLSLGRTRASILGARAAFVSAILLRRLETFAQVS